MTDSSYAIHVVSFGYRYSGLPAEFTAANEDGAGGGFVFDCRALPNPYWDEALRPFNGRDREIREFMARHPEVEAFADQVRALVLAAARARADRGKGVLRVAFGCTGGRHRSVYQAERLRAALEGEDFPVVLRHVDIAGRPAAAALSRP